MKTKFGLIFGIKNVKNKIGGDEEEEEGEEEEERYENYFCMDK